MDFMKSLEHISVEHVIGFVIVALVSFIMLREMIKLIQIFPKKAAVVIGIMELIMAVILGPILLKLSLEALWHQEAIKEDRMFIMLFWIPICFFISMLFIIIVIKIEQTSNGQPSTDDD